MVWGGGVRGYRMGEGCNMGERKGERETWGGRGVSLSSPPLPSSHFAVSLGRKSHDSVPFRGQFYREFCDTVSFLESAMNIAPSPPAPSPCSLWIKGG